MEDQTTAALYNILVSVLMAAPVIIVALVGCVLVLLRRRRHPKATLLALLGLLVYLVTALLFPVVYAVLPVLLYARSWSADSYTVLYRSLSFVHYLVHAVALALLLAAVLAGRGAQPNNAERNFA